MKTIHSNLAQIILSFAILSNGAALANKQNSLHQTSSDSRHQPSDPEVVKDIDLKKYSGLWHEVAHSKNFFQRNCLRSTAEYQVINDLSISVHNICYKADQKVSDIEGIAKITDPKVPAKLRVRFNFFARGDYWVTHLDKDYRWAVVSGPKKSSIFILSRTLPMNPEEQRSLLHTLENEGYDLSTLVFDQSSL